MKTRFVLIALFLSAISSLNAVESSKNSLASRTDVPNEFKRVIEFLDFVKQDRNGDSLYTTTKVVRPKWDVDQFISFISKKGVTFTDVNEDGHLGWEALKGHFPFQEVKMEIAADGSRIYNHFWTVGTSSANPHLRFKFEKKDNKYFVTIGDAVFASDTLKLTFVLENGKYRLIQSDFLVPYEGDL